MCETGARGELVELYLTECEQLLQRFERMMLDADQQEELTDPAELFRVLHTLKGSSAMMEYAPLVEMTHGFENILAAIKLAGQPVRGETLQPLLDAGLAFLTYYRGELAHIASGQAITNNAALSARIAELSAAQGVVPAKAPKKTRSGPQQQETAYRDGEIRARVQLKTCPLPHIRASIIMKSIGKLCAALTTDPKELEANRACSDAVQSDGFIVGFIPAPSVSAEDVLKKLSAQPYVLSVQAIYGLEPAPQTAPDTAEQESATADPFQSVMIAQLVVNRLIGFLSEIASAETAVETCALESGFHSRRLWDLFSTLRHTVADANILAAQIGAHAMDSVFLQMQRAVRSMSRDLHKEIKLQTVGADVQVDKSVLDILSDSLIHIIRNAVDHGIEMPDVRVQKGKPRAGLITLHAAKKNDYLTVTITDDGAGVNPKAVLDRAEKRGKLTKPKARYTDGEALNLLLSSGVSTNDAVTRYSGRGVGLDTVVRRIKQAGGTVSIDSAVGQGTAFTLKIPITLLMIDGIEVLLDSGDKLIVPANAIHHIACCDGIPDKLVFRENTYTHLPYPDMQAGEAVAGAGYALLLTRDYGPFFLRARRVSMMSTYYVKQLPKYVSDALGGNYVFSGCVLSADTALCCVLDVGKLMNVSRTGEYLERQESL